MEAIINRANVITDVAVTPDEMQVMKLLGEYVAKFQKNLPINNDGLPIAYIDPQMLAGTGLIESQITRQIIEQATIMIDYLEGYPIIDGLPFWEKLDGETLYFYKLFKCYREQKEENGIRAFTHIAELSNLNVNFISSLAKAYHWNIRTKAYDIYRQKKFETIRQENIQKMENKHTNAAKEMFTLCLEGLREVLKTFRDSKTGLTQEGLREWFRLAVKLERLSLGMPPDKPLDNKEQEAINVITNYKIDEVNQTKNVNVKVDKLQAVVDVLAKTGALKKFLTESGNGHEKTNLIKVKEGGVTDVKTDIS